MNKVWWLSDHMIMNLQAAKSLVILAETELQSFTWNVLWTWEVLRTWKEILTYLIRKPTGTGKVVPMQATNVCWGSTGRPTVQHIDTRWRRALTFALRSLCSLDKETWSLNRRLGGLHSRSRRWARQIKCRSSTRIRTTVPLFSSH